MAERMGELLVFFTSDVSLTQMPAVGAREHVQAVSVMATFSQENAYPHRLPSPGSNNRKLSIRK